MFLSCSEVGLTANGRRRRTTPLGVTAGRGRVGSIRLPQADCQQRTQSGDQN